MAATYVTPRPISAANSLAVRSLTGICKQRFLRCRLSENSFHPNSSKPHRLPLVVLMQVDSIQEKSPEFRKICVHIVGSIVVVQKCLSVKKISVKKLIFRDLRLLEPQERFNPGAFQPIHLGR